MRYTVAAVIAALTLSTAGYAQTSVSETGTDSCAKYLAAIHGHPPGSGRVLTRLLQSSLFIGVSRASSPIGLSSSDWREPPFR
jgi:hypothetical protein